MITPTSANMNCKTWGIVRAGARWLCKSIQIERAVFYEVAESGVGRFFIIRLHQLKMDSWEDLQMASVTNPCGLSHEERKRNRECSMPAFRDPIVGRVVCLVHDGKPT